MPSEHDHEGVVPYIRVDIADADLIAKLAEAEARAIGCSEEQARAAIAIFREEAKRIAIEEGEASLDDPPEAGGLLVADRIADRIMKLEDKA